MKVRIICVGKLKEKFFRDAADEYIKRLTPFTKVEVFEIKDEKAPQNYSDEQVRAVKDKEGEKILEKLGPHYTIALDPYGRMLSSEELSTHMERLMNTGKSTVNFVIGGSNGLSESVLRRADMKLSFSKMTFPHQLFRVMLLEQIYRAFKISQGGTYHK